MDDYLVAVFDDYSQLGNAILGVKNKNSNAKISLIGLNPGDSLVERKLEGDEELDQTIGDIFKGSLSSSVLNEIGSVNQIEVSGLGGLVLSGELGDILSISGFLTGEKLGGIQSALINDLGLSEDEAVKYANYVSNGQALLLVRAENKDEINETLENFGALDIRTQKIISPK
jgi:hypothetical protein